IVGLGLLGVTQITVWTLSVVGLFSLARARFPDMGGLSLPGDVLLVMLLLFVPAYLLVAACFSTVGAAVTAVQEGQQFGGIISLLCVSPVWFLPLIIKAPGSALSVIASIAPFTGPIVMMQRIAVTPVPAWQIGLAVLIQSLAALGMIWVAGRVLRFGMLRYGKRLGLAELRQALRRREASHEH
ncbi:MAG TPA: ABC transporter permease, partial [Herpetosiphonaceae bacterium]